MKSARILFVTFAGVLVITAIVQGGTTNTWKTSGTTVWNLGSNWNPDPGGAPSDAVNIGTTTAANAPDLGGNPYTIKLLYLAGNSGYINGNGVKGSGGPLTLTADSVGFAGLGLRTYNNYTEYVYANLRLGMAARTTEHIWNILWRNTAGSALYINGKIDGMGTLHITGAPLANVQANTGGAVYYLNQYDGATTGAPFNGDTLIDMKTTFVFYPSNFTSSVNYRFGLNAPSGSDTWGGTITLTAGSDTLMGGPAFRFVPISGTASATTVTLQNDFVVSSMPGVELGIQRGKALGTYALPKVVYGGTLTLAGRLQITSRTDAGTPTVPGADGSADATAFVPFSNGIVIDQSTATRASVRMNRLNAIMDFPATGVISDNAGTYRNPFIIATTDGQVRFNAANSSYANGTLISWCGRCYYQSTFADLVDGSATMRIDGNAASCFGTGGLTVLPGGRILLDVAGAMTSSQQVTLQGSSAALSVLGLPDDNNAAHFPSFASSSYGVIGLSGTSQTPFNTLMANGVGDNVFLGAGLAAGTFNGSSLAAASDHVYRLGGGGRGNALTLNVSGTDNGCLTGPNAVQVNAPTYNGGGNVYILDSTNTFTGTLTVYSGLLNGGTSQLRGYARSLASTPFGSASGAVDLIGADLHMYNASLTVNTAVTKGATTFTGESKVSIENANVGTLQTFTLGTLTRSNRGILLIQDVTQPTRLALTHQILVTAPGADLSTPLNGMVPPYYLVNNGANQFATYTTTGFTNVTYSANKLETPSGANDLIYQDVAVALTASRSCYALKTGAAITAQNLGDNWTLAIGSGGLILGADIGSTANTHVNVDFGGKEAIVYSGNNSTIYGVLSNTGGNGLTKSGSGSLTITNLNNAFTGPVTVNRGYLYYTPDKDDGSAPGSLGPTSNTIYLNGGYLIRANSPLSPAGYSTLHVGRTITLGPLGGGLGTGTVIAYRTITVNGKITGPGALFLSGGREPFVINNNTNDYTGGTLVDANTTTSVSSSGKLGQGPLILMGDRYAGCTFYLTGDDNLHYTAGPEKFLPLQVSGAATAYFQSLAPVAGSLTGDGDVLLGNAGVNNTTLTVGKDGANATFYGFINQASGQTGSLVKDGTGTWNLYGAQSYSGQTTVTNGTLNLMGRLKGACNVGPNGTISGLGAIGGDLTLNSGTLAVQLSANTPVLQVTGGLNIKPGSRLSVSLAPGFNPGVQDIAILTTTTGITTPGNLTVVTGGMTARAVGNNLVVSRSRSTLIEVR